MTRETRVGLLVGLLFIVTFGLLLAEFTRGKTPQTSSAATAGAAPASKNWGVPNVALIPADHAGGDVSVAPRGEGSVDVAVGRPHDSLVIPEEEVRREPLSPPAERIERRDDRVAMGPPPLPPLPPQPLPAGSKVHKVEPNDSLMKIARKYYGRETEYKRILDANRDRLKDERALKIGMELTIPPLPAPVAAPADATTPAPVPSIGSEGSRLATTPTPAPAVGLDRTPVVRPEAMDAAVLALGHVSTPVSPAPTPVVAARKYTVEKGDSLSKIARKVNTTPDKLAKANRLGDPDELQIGMVLTVPQ